MSDPKTMRGAWTLAAASLVLAVSCGGGGRSEPAVIAAGDLEMRVSVDPAAARVGENRLWIELRDRGGEPVGGADVSARVHMHAMGAMPAMGGPAAVEEVRPGVHAADFELDMGSTWRVEVRARTSDGRELEAEGSLTVGTPGVRLAAAGANAAAHAEHGAEDAPAARHAAEFSLAPERIQKIGVKTVTAERAPLATAIRALGLVTWDESELADVSLKVRGWVGELEVDAVGDPVEAGQVLFTLYSPELYAAQEEYLQALASQERARTSAAPERADYLVRAARNRLRLWDVAEADLDALTRRRTPLDHVPIRAPRSGYVLEKNVVEGSGIVPGERLYRIAPLDRLWIEAEVYESEVGLVEPGQRATVELPLAPGVRQEARVAYVLPAFSREARTARVRIELENADLRLRPDMYANVRIDVEREPRLVVPQSAVLYAGDRSFVFRALGEGRFRPQQVEVGLQAGDRVEILAGLEPGERVVSSATFLIASESRLRAALDQW
jgi:Cu(I)/Ag(I) efflux system membrane fusion protein